MVGDHLVERPVAVREVGSREVDDHLGGGGDLVDDLEVENCLALRLHRAAPVGVSLDGHERPERRQVVLGGEEVEVLEVRKVVDLRQDDGLAAAVEAAVSERLQVVER